LGEGLTTELVGWEFKSLPENIYDSELCKGFPMEKMAQIHLILGENKKFPDCQIFMISSSR
jgi:hypothetical protein